MTIGIRKKNPSFDLFFLSEENHIESFGTRFYLHKELAAYRYMDFFKGQFLSFSSQSSFSLFFLREKLFVPVPCI